MDAGFRAITGVIGAEGDTVDVVGVNSWVKAGIEADNFFIPRPLEFPTPLDDPGTVPDRDDGPDNVEEAGLDRAPASERDVVGVVDDS